MDEIRLTRRDFMKTVGVIAASCLGLKLSKGENINCEEIIVPFRSLRIEEYNGERCIGTSSIEKLELGDKVIYPTIGLWKYWVEGVYPLGTRSTENIGDITFIIPSENGEAPMKLDMIISKVSKNGVVGTTVDVSNIDPNLIKKVKGIDGKTYKRLKTYTEVEKEREGTLYIWDIAGAARGLLVEEVFNNGFKIKNFLVHEGLFALIKKDRKTGEISLEEIVYVYPTTKDPVPNVDAISIKPENNSLDWLARLYYNPEINKRQINRDLVVSTLAMILDSYSAADKYIEDYKKNTATASPTPTPIKTPAIENTPQNFTNLTQTPVNFSYQNNSINRSLRYNNSSNNSTVYNNLISKRNRNNRNSLGTVTGILLTIGGSLGGLYWLLKRRSTKRGKQQ